MTYFQEGYDAYDHTKGLVSSFSCPYRMGTYARKSWLEGLAACRRFCIKNVMDGWLTYYTNEGVV